MGDYGTGIGITYMTANNKSGFATLIGRPNVGKSTLMNQLIGQKIAITSHKPQTTRNRIQTVYTSEEGQIVFVDTPGIHKAKNKLGEYMVHVAERTLREVDVILWLVEPSDFIGPGDRQRKWLIWNGNFYFAANSVIFKRNTYILSTMSILNHRQEI